MDETTEEKQLDNDEEIVTSQDSIEDNNLENEQENILIDEDEELVLDSKEQILENEKDIEENVKSEINDEEKSPADVQREIINSLISNLEKRNQEELKKYEEELNLKADNIIESLDPNKYSIQQLYDARDHLNKKIDADIKSRKETLDGYLEFIKNSMNEQVLREENIQKVNSLLKEKQELMQKIKDKEELIQSIENDTAKSLKAVEDEIAKLQEEKEKLENEKEEGQIGKH